MSLEEVELFQCDFTQAPPVHNKCTYPNAVVFKDLNSFVVLNLESNPTDGREPSNTEEFEIVDSVLKDHLLWVVLKTSDLVVVDIKKNLKIKIINETYKIYKIISKNKNLQLLSESGDLFDIPWSVEELNKKIDEGIKEIPLLTLKKAGKCPEGPETIEELLSINELNIFIENGILKSRCTVTGLTEVITADQILEHILLWQNKFVVVGKSNMWIIDIQDSKIVHKFERAGHYCPLAVHQNVLYYTLQNLTQVQLWSALFPTETFGSQTASDKSENNINLSLCQENLKNDLNLLVKTLLTKSKPLEEFSCLHDFYGKIEDLSFLIEISSKLCRHSISYKSILYPLQEKVYKTNQTDLYCQINDLINKTDILEYIVFKGQNSYENMNLYDLSFKDLCITFIQKLDMDLASICLLKYSEMYLNISSDDVLDILNSIPTKAKIGAIIMWFKNFSPPLLENNPYMIDVFVRWSTDKIFDLEQSTYWPKIAIKFLDEIEMVLESSFKTISIRPVSMDGITSLKDQLNNILELRENYKINMLLNEFNSQSPIEITLIMLRRCYTEDLESFLQNYLSMYATKHHIDADEILRSYIENEALSGGGQIDGVRLKIILNAFQNNHNKLSCLLQVLKVLDVPWNTTVFDLATVAVASITKDFMLCESDREIAEEIQNELNYASVKVIWKKYNFSHTSVDYNLLLKKITKGSSVDLNDLKIIRKLSQPSFDYGCILYINRCMQDSDIRAALDYFYELEEKVQRLVLKTMKSKFEQLVKRSTSNGSLERNYLDFIKGTKSLEPVEMSSVEEMYYIKNSNIHKDNSEKIGIILAASRNDHFSSFADSKTSSTHICSRNNQQNLLNTLFSMPSSHKVRLFVQGLIEYFVNNNNRSQEMNSFFIQFQDEKNTQFLIEVYNMLVEIMTICREEQIHELLNIVSILNVIMNNNVLVKNLTVAWKFHYIYFPVVSIVEMNELIHFYNAQSLYENQNVQNFDFLIFRMLSHYLAVSQTTRNNALVELTEKISKKLLYKLSTSQNVDYLFFLNLLLILKTSQNFENTDSVIEVLKGPNDLLLPLAAHYLSSSVIVKTFKIDNMLIGNNGTYSPQYLLKSKFNINLTEILLPEHTEETWDVKVILFYVLKQYPCMDFKRLSDICRTLNISIDDGLSLQLISLLSNWNLNYKIIYDEYGCRHLVLNNEEAELKKCLFIWDSIESKEFITDILNDFWKNGEVTLHGRLISINPYYYEVFLYIHKLIANSISEAKYMKDYLILNYLKDYRRSSNPRQYEFEWFSDKGMFPEIGYVRLPFHLFMREDMWLNLKFEITLETYERWLPVVALLCLDPDLQTAKDMVCSNAVKQTMTSKSRSEDSDGEKKELEPWTLISQEERLLRAAHKCVGHIANMEWAGACLFYVLQGCSRGADQVAAADICYQFAQRWAAFQPGNRAVRQMERLHATLSTRHALYKIKWACDELLRLTTEPAQLIHALYQHPEFVNKIVHCDINRAANEIADKNGINVSSIRIQLLESLLGKPEKENTRFKNIALNTKELITAKYILKATCPKMGAIYLSRIAFDDESDYNKSKKLRALQCLMSVTDSDTAIKVTNHDRDFLWVSLLNLLFTVKLENVDMPWIVSTFMQDKIRALELLLPTVKGKTEGLMITTQLVQRYGKVKDVIALIPLLMQVNLYDEILTLLLKSASYPPNHTICAAWRAVLLLPFQRADYPSLLKTRNLTLPVVTMIL